MTQADPDPGGGSASDPEEPTADRPVFYAHVIVTAFTSAVFALVWFVGYQLVDALIWDSDLVGSNGWIVPVIILSFSLAVGLGIRYLDAPTSISGSPLDEMTGDPRHIDWRKLPVTVLQSLTSLFSGAVVGPEGALGRFAAQIAAWYGERFEVPVALRGRLVFASAAAAYNGLMQNPIFTAVLAGDMARQTSGIWPSMTANLLGGGIGFAVFTLLGGYGLADFLGLGAVPEGTLGDSFWVVGFAIVGMALAVFTGLSLQVAGVVFARLDGRPVTRALVGGVVLSVVGLLAPILLFSGESAIHDVVDDPAAYGFWVLLGMALAKVVLLAVSFKTGFLGGPIFPAIFAATSVSLAFSLVLTDLPFVLIEAGVLAGTLTAMFRTPLMVVLLTAFFLGANTELVAMIVAAVVTVSMFMPIVERQLRAMGTGRRGA